MSHKKLWIAGAVVLAVLVLGSFAAVSAQELDGHWFVVTANVAARAVHMDTAAVTAYATQVKFYIYFDWEGEGSAPRGQAYYYEIYSQEEPGEWESWDSDDSTSPYNEQFFDDLYIHAHKKDGSYFRARVSVHASSVLNLFHGGGVVYSGRDPSGQKALYGTVAFTGKLATSLPFSIYELSAKRQARQQSTTGPKPDRDRPERDHIIK